MSREVLLAVTLKRKGVMSAPTSTTPLLTIQQAYKRYSAKINLYLTLLISSSLSLTSHAPPPTSHAPPTPSSLSSSLLHIPLLLTPSPLLLLFISLLLTRPSPSSNSGPRFAIVLIHLLQFGLRIVEVGLAYLLMLAVMTFNGWLFLTVVLGTAVGYFVSNLVKWSCLPLLG